MSERRRLTLVGPDGPFDVDAEIATEPPWTLRLDLGDSGVIQAEADDLFGALEAVRLRLEPSQILICCQGAQLNVFPSGMSRQMSGGRRAYALTPARRPESSDLVDIFDPADCTDVVTVEQQIETIGRMRGG